MASLQGEKRVRREESGVNTYTMLLGTYPSVSNTEVSSFQGVGIEELHCILFI